MKRRLARSVCVATADNLFVMANAPKRNSGHLSQENCNDDVNLSWSRHANDQHFVDGPGPCISG